jgi:hypothetical protein
MPLTTGAKDAATVAPQISDGGDTMAWVQIQHAAQGTWDDHEKVVALIGDRKPDGLILRAAGEVDGRWKAVSIWESKDAFERFHHERIMPAVEEALGEDMAAAGPPPTEWFEVKYLMTG